MNTSKFKTSYGAGKQLVVNYIKIQSMTVFLYAKASTYFSLLTYSFINLGLMKRWYMLTTIKTVSIIHDLIMKDYEKGF